MIKNDPQRKMMRKAVIAMFIVIVGLVLIAISNLFLPASSRSSTISDLPFIYLFYLVIMLLSFGLAFTLLRQTDKRRALAMQQDQSLLALEQPVPDENGLALPANIELRPSKISYYFLAGIMLIALLIFIIALFVISPAHASNRPTVILIGLGFVVVFFLLMFFIFFFLFRKRIIYQVHVDEQGIEVTYNKIRTRVNWNEARLFTVNQVKKPRRPRIYELVGNDTLVRWMWIPRNAPVWQFLRPVIPYDEYERQMQGLLQLVEAKTNLPLYDISNPKAKWYM